MQTRDAAIRIADLERRLHAERTARLKAEQSAAGRKTVILKLQAALLGERADKAEKAAEGSS